MRAGSNKFQVGKYQENSGKPEGRGTLVFGQIESLLLGPCYLLLAREARP
jgi:hypothetical protein